MQDNQDNQTLKAEFILHASRAFFASAWADAAEESNNDNLIAGQEIMQVMPATIDPAAIHAAETLYADMERVNGHSMLMLYSYAQDNAAGDRECTVKNFAHYSAMQAMGHGVGLLDAFGEDVNNNILIPDVEFNSCNLEMDYFQPLEIKTEVTLIMHNVYSSSWTFLGVFYSHKKWTESNYCKATKTEIETILRVKLQSNSEFYYIKPIV